MLGKAVSLIARRAVERWEFNLLVVHVAVDDDDVEAEAARGVKGMTDEDGYEEISNGLS